MFKVTTTDAEIKVYASTMEQAYSKVIGYGYEPCDIITLGVCYE